MTSASPDAPSPGMPSFHPRMPDTHCGCQPAAIRLLSPFQRIVPGIRRTDPLRPGKARTVVSIGDGRSPPTLPVSAACLLPVTEVVSVSSPVPDTQPQYKSPSGAIEASRLEPRTSLARYAATQGNSQRRGEPVNTPQDRTSPPYPIPSGLGDAHIAQSLQGAWRKTENTVHHGTTIIEAGRRDGAKAATVYGPLRADCPR
jgi:hypothetical protein